MWRIRAPRHGTDGRVRSGPAHPGPHRNASPRPAAQPSLRFRVVGMHRVACERRGLEAPGRASAAARRARDDRYARKSPGRAIGPGPGETSIADRRLPCVPCRRPGRRPGPRHPAPGGLVPRHGGRAGRALAAGPRPLPALRPVPAARRFAARGGPGGRGRLDVVGHDGGPRRGLVDEVVAAGLLGPGTRVVDLASHGGHTAPMLRDRGIDATVYEAVPWRAAALRAGGLERLHFLELGRREESLTQRRSAEINERRREHLAAQPAAGPRGRRTVAGVRRRGVDRRGVHRPRVIQRNRPFRVGPGWDFRGLKW